MAWCLVKNRDNFTFTLPLCLEGHRVQIASGAHPASYLMGTGGSFPEDEAVGAWSWSLTSI
jgi:hypothetical protein